VASTGRPIEQAETQAGFAAATAAGRARAGRRTKPARLRILVVCHRFPFPPAGGAKVRAFHVIRHLNERHEVTVASMARSDAEAAEGAGIAEHCARYEMERVSETMQTARMVLALPTPRPSSFAFFDSAALARRIAALAARERFDLVLAHSSSVARYVEALRGPVKIMDFCDMDSQKWLEYARYKPFPLSLGYALEGRKLERQERTIAHGFDVCTVATRSELETLDGLGTGAATDWFPNGVDTQYFTPTAEPYDPDTLVFVGRMDYFPNQECMVRFCDDVFPRVRAQRPAAKLIIVGADPTSAVRALAGREGVTVTGSVPDVRPYLSRAAVMVATLNIARGTQNKILEGMAAGVPVVTTPLAAGGVDAHASTHFLVASTADEQAAAIVRVLTDRSERDRLARAGRERMLSHHTWAMSMQRLDGIVHRCLERRA